MFPESAQNSEVTLLVHKLENFMTGNSIVFGVATF